MVSALPVWPLSPRPQHHTLPSLSRAHVPAAFAPSSTAFDTPATTTGTDAVSYVPLLSPSWPRSLWPQHVTPPELVTAHVCAPPAAMAVRPDSIGTVTGVVEFIPVPVAPNRL